MSILSTQTGYVGFTVIDDATGKEVPLVLWVDDTNLEYAAISQPPRIVGLEYAQDIVKVTAVAVNHSAREIHVNTTPAAVTASTVSVGRATSTASACDECTNEGACRRIGQCMRFKCEFGKVDKP